MRKLGGVLAALAALSLLGVRPAPAGDFVGPSDCTSCHDHADQTKAWDASKHSRSLDVFEGQKATEFLKALGIKDPYSDFCTKCHATVVDGNPDYGVSCESCHGGASAYLKPHQTKGSYEQALTLGMLRTKDLAVRAKNCVGCHIVTNAKLLRVGHPDGRKFDLVAFSNKIIHWKETHTTAEINAAFTNAVKALGGMPSKTAQKAPPVPTPPKPKTPTQEQPVQQTPTQEQPVQQTPTLITPTGPGSSTAAPVLPPDEPWPANQPSLDSIASLQARLIQVFNALLAERGIKGNAAASLDPPDPNATTPEARLIDLQRRILALQRRLLASGGGS